MTFGREHVKVHWLCIKSDNCAHSLLLLGFISAIPWRTRKVLQANHICPSRSPNSGMFEFRRRDSEVNPDVLFIPPDIRGYALVELCFMVRYIQSQLFGGRLLTYPLTLVFFMRPCGCSLRYDWWIVLIDRYQTHNYSQVTNIPKLNEEDTTLTVGNATGEKLTIPVPKGVRIAIDTPGLHYNRERIYWFGSGISALLLTTDFFTNFFFFFFFCSSLLERSSFLQTWTLLGRLAKGCFHTVQRWWVVGRGGLSKYYSSNDSVGPRACLGKK